MGFQKQKMEYFKLYYNARCTPRDRSQFFNKETSGNEMKWVPIVLRGENKWDVRINVVEIFILSIAPGLIFFVVLEFIPQGRGQGKKWPKEIQRSRKP